MGADTYKVKVLHFVNPYLIWVEVVEEGLSDRNDHVLEQIGVYGVLPEESKINIEDDTVARQRCEDWIPAASFLIQKLLVDAVEVTFTPTHIDRRSSIFDDKIHKYGDLIVTKQSGKKKSLTKSLIRNGVAIYDECQFHQELHSGKLKTKLSHTEANSIITQIEKIYLKKEKKPSTIRKQTNLSNTAQQVESALTVENVEALNIRNAENFSVEEYLKNKFKDLDLCLDIGEESVGRAVDRRKKSESQSPVKKKLEISKERNECQAIINQTKLCLLVNAKKKLAEFEKTRTDSENEGINVSGHEVRKDTQVSHVPASDVPKTDVPEELDSSSEGPPKWSEADHVFVDPDPDHVDYKEPIVRRLTDKPTVMIENYISKELAIKKYEARKKKELERLQAQNDSVFEKKDVLDKPEENNEKMNMVAFKAGRKGSKSKKKNKIPIQEYDILKEKQIAFGPPDIDKSKLSLQIVPKSEFETQPQTIETEIVMSMKQDTYANVDTDVDFEISNKTALEDIRNKVAASTIEPKKASDSPKQHNNSTDTDKSSIGVIKSSPVSSDKETSGKSSSLLKKLRLYKSSPSKFESSYSSNSDTSIKDSSTSVEEPKPISPKKISTELDSDDESAPESEILEEVAKEYPQTPKAPEQQKKIQPQVSHVNPFKNIDPNLSVFVDKLVTPILMVHSKSNKRIQPSYELREIHFSPQIHVALKGMKVERPMTLQTVSWMTILRGYSTFIISPKGSGKTMGYLPAVCRLVSDSNSDIDSSGPNCIIVCATAVSVAEVEVLSKRFLNSKDKVFACVAGMDELDIATSLLNGCDLLICTPSILVRLLQNTEFGVDLRRLTTFVLDDCERLSDVYINEIKFFLLKIKEMLKSRAAKELKVQYVLASRLWCDFMEPLAKKAPNTVVSIGAFQECVLYSKSKMSATFVTKENKIQSIIGFLETVDVSKKTVIICRTDDEVDTVQKALEKEKYVVFACNNTMTVQDLYKINLAWNSYEEPVSGPILVCCDGNLSHMNVTDAHNLIHYSLPNLFSTFCKRFSALNDHYPSIFADNKETVNIKILLDDTNVEQLPKIMHFIKRCTDDVPKVLDEICEKVLKEKDASKATNMVPVCDNILAYGFCPDFWNCIMRHAVLKEHDEPKNSVPKSGQITFKILHYHNAILYSARILSTTVNGLTTKYPQTYSILSMKLATYFAKESNRRLHGTPKIGDVCAVQLKQNFYMRCQVAKIISKYQTDNPNYVLVKVIDEERYDTTRDIYLYHLPDDMKNVDTHVVQVRLANIQPKDKDITFSNLAKDLLKDITDKNDDFYVRGNIALTIGNCVILDNMELCRDLASLNKTVVKCSFRDELKAHSIDNPDHVRKLKELCQEGGMAVKDKKRMESPVLSKPLPEGRWAHLDKDDMSTVYFASAEDPGTFFIRLTKFEDCMNLLIKDIQKHVTENNEALTDVSKGDIVLSKFPDDGMYDRARIDEVYEDKVKCFFVDQGDWRDVNKKDLSPITEKLITQLPYQAIECRLIGVKPCSETWTEFTTNWFINCFEDHSGNLKQIYAKYFKKEPAQHTGGHKYGVVLIDTNSDSDIVINTTMIDVNLAEEDDAEIDLLMNLSFERVKEQESSDEEVDWEKVPRDNQVQKVEQPVPLDNIFLKKPLRSVPLVGSDDEFDDMDFNMPEDFMDIFKPVINAQHVPTLPALPPNKPLQIQTQTDDHSDGSSDLQVIPSPKLQALDSDDLTSSDISQVNENIDKKVSVTTEIKKDIAELRKPKLTWRQTTTNIFIKILIIVDEYNLKIDDRKIKFDAVANDTEYGFDFDLYGVVDSKNSVHSNKGQYIYVNLRKVLKKKWLMLNKDGVKKFISYDVDYIDDTDDDDDVIDDGADAIRNLNHSESDTDEEFVDDANFRYKR